jgi:tRNA 2-thiocytidine biosynthesis protein TtcA
VSTAGPSKARSEAARFRRIARAMGQAIADYSMIDDGDRILCAVSGGKDSLVMHHMLAGLRLRAPVDFQLIALTVDQGQPGFPGQQLRSYMDDQGHDYRIVEEDTYSIVKDKVPEGKTPCSLCSRLRRGILYRMARELGCNKLALGHHRDDVIVTLMLNLFFSGQLGAMPPKLVCDEGDIVVIRPLAYCVEDDLAAHASELGLPVVPCGLCSTQPNSQRRAVSELLATLEGQHPGVRASLLAALRNVRPSQLLDVGLWKALGLSVASDEGESDWAPAGESDGTPQVPAAARPVSRNGN